jgi:hypothetical protein
MAPGSLLPAYACQASVRLKQHARDHFLPDLPKALSNPRWLRCAENFGCQLCEPIVIYVAAKALLDESESHLDGQRKAPRCSRKST